MIPVREALEAARNHLITLGGDPRSVIAEFGSPSGDEIQAAVLDVIDEALSAAPEEPCAWLRGLQPDAEDEALAVCIKSDPGAFPVYTAPQPAAGWDRGALRKLVDAVWNAATESTAVPSTKWADRLIDSVHREAPAPAEGEATILAGLNLNSGMKPDTAEARLREAVEDAIDTLESMDLHIHNPLYERLVKALSPPSGGDEAKESEGGEPDVERTQRRLAVSDDGLGPMQAIPRETPSVPSEPSPPADRMEIVARAVAVLAELTAVVRGECPSILNEDSGGDAALSIEIDEVLRLAALDGGRDV